MSTYKEGDLIEATNGEAVVRGRINATSAFEDGWVTVTGINAVLSPRDWTLTLIERAPESLPTEYGAVVRFSCDDDRRHVLAWLAGDKTWDLLDSRGDSHKGVTDPFAWIREQGMTYGGLTRLVPESVN